MKKQKRDKNGRFVKANLETRKITKVKIYGFLGETWIREDRGGEYFLVKDGDNFYCYNPKENKAYSPHYSDSEIRSFIKDTSYAEIPYSYLQYRFPNHMNNIDKILGIKPKSQKDEKLTLDNIKIGSLYYNFGDCTVCRIIEVVGRLIYASWHKGPATPYGVSSFRKATKEEIDNYLKEAEELKD